MSNRKQIAAARRRSALLRLLALATFLVGCGTDHAVERDAGAVPGDDAGAPAGDASTPDASSGLRFASATATLVPLESNDPSPLQGTALFRATQVGVDLEVTISGCSGLSPSPLEILEAGDCSQASLQAPVWTNGRGAGLGVTCAGATAGFGPLRYARRGGHPDSWTVGDSRDSDVVGHVLVMLDGQTGQARACGVIARGEDVVWTPLPPPDEPPSAAARAQLSGFCFAKQLVSATTDGCPDPQALALCASRHCDVGSCAEACREYSSCLDARGDVCQAAFECPQSAACAQCQNDILTCTLGYCAEDLTCVAPVTPDGPCSQLLACCALQGEYADRCLSIFQIETSGGDANCFGAINDREAVGHLRAPCTFNIDVAPSHGPDAGIVGPGPSSAPLADDVAGTPCSRDADCPGGQCTPGPALPGAAASEGFCTRACTTKSDCGEGGLCISNGQGEGRCLGVCGTQGACREGFRCAGSVQSQVFGSAGACLPMPPTDTLPDGAVGRTCKVAADCPGGQCASRSLLGTAYPSNYCTARCYEDGACGADGVCLVPLGSPEPGHCLLACRTHDDCKREGYRCWTINDGKRLLHACYPGADPLPDHSVGLPCEDESACGAQHAECAKEMPYGSFAPAEIARAPGGYCTQACSLDEECGAGAQCVNVNTRGGLCFASCSDTAPCRDGYTCHAHLRDDGDAKVCVPEPPP